MDRVRGHKLLGAGSNEAETSAQAASAGSASARATEAQRDDGRDYPDLMSEPESILSKKSHNELYEAIQESGIEPQLSGGGSAQEGIGDDRRQ